MKINLSSSIGTGSTKLSAFDNALLKVGLYNYNIIRLSSVIPKNAEVLEDKFRLKNKEGARAYVVYAEEKTEGQENIAAGLGWYFFEDYGVFVEHSIKSKDVDKKILEKEIEKRIENSLRDLCKNRGKKFNKEKLFQKIEILEKNGKPACVFIGALFKIEKW